MRYLGGFVSCAGGIFNAINAANELDINTIMIHPSPPQRWNSTKFKKEDIDKFNETRKNSKVEKLFFHGIYLINMANPDNQKFHLSKVSLVNYLDLAEQINADSVIFHVGSFKDQNDSAEGFARIIKGINWIFNESDNERTLSLEVAAGSGKVVGAQFEDLARIYEGVDNNSRIKFCLDTAHLYASGYDLKNELNETMNLAKKYLGIDNISSIHFNDSKTEFNSKKDRHENLGEGTIGEEAMKNFLNHDLLKNKPFMLETPGMGDIETAKAQINTLKSWAQ